MFGRRSSRRKKRNRTTTTTTTIRRSRVRTFIAPKISRTIALREAPSLLRGSPRRQRSRRRATPGPTVFRAIRARTGRVGLFKPVQTTVVRSPLVSKPNKRQQPPKRLCKCHPERSRQQKVVSRALFAGHGSRGLNTNPKHACEC